MNRDPILFRVDGTSRSGHESFWRCLIFSAALQRRRRPIHFLSDLEPGELAFAVKRVGNAWLGTREAVGTPEDLEETLQEIRRLRPAAVVVDSPNASEGYLERLRGEGVTVVSMDHQAMLRFPSHLVINPLLGFGADGYELAPQAQILAGPRYGLVRPEIRRLRPLRAQEPSEPFRALVALGDDDPNRQSIPMVKSLLNHKQVDRVDVIVRGYHPDLDELREMAEGLPEKLEIAVEAQEIAAKLIRCHFAVTAGDTWSLELTCVGIPQLMIVQDESHWPTAQALEEEGAATCLGWHENVSEQTLKVSVENLLEDPAERKAMSRAGRRLIDGRGADRIVNGLEVMLHSNRPVELDLAA